MPRDWKIPGAATRRPTMPGELRRPERTFTIRQLCLEFKCTPRALRFYEDRGLLAPARQGLNRVYSYKDRARLQLILRGKRVGLSLAEIREFRERIVALEQQREDIDHAITELYDACAHLEALLAKVRPDLLPSAEEYDKILRARVDGHHESLGAKHP